VLHLIPAPLHKAALRLAHRLRGAMRRWLGLSSHGVALAALDAEGRVLLVRHSYGSGGWALPGGGRKPWEDPEACLRREIREELNCQLREIELFEVRESVLQGAPNRTHVFLARLESEVRIDGRELIAADWFQPTALPEPMVHISRRQLERIFR
jgi:ADP-ribose pyrophosphatase YjhB (NUDIX family)